MFDEIADIIESFEVEIEDGGPDASNICVPIDDAKKLMRAYSDSKAHAEKLLNALGKYGAHKQECASVVPRFSDPRPCTCGLDAALAERN